MNLILPWKEEKYGPHEYRYRAQSPGVYCYIDFFLGAHCKATIEFHTLGRAHFENTPDRQRIRFFSPDYEDIPKAQQWCEAELVPFGNYLLTRYKPSKSPTFAANRENLTRLLTGMSMGVLM